MAGRIDAATTAADMMIGFLTGISYFIACDCKQHREDLSIRSTIVLRSEMWQVVLTDTAVRQLRRVPKSERGPIKDGIRRHLVESDPAEPTRDKFRLRRVSEHAEFELRIEPWRVFYRIREDLVEVVLIGERKGNKLIIGGEEFIL